jgi:hypothetical protein
MRDGNGSIKYLLLAHFHRFVGRQFVPDERLKQVRTAELAAKLRQYGADWPAVGEAAHAVVREARDAGVWTHGGGVQQQPASTVGTDGEVSDGPLPGTRAAIGGGGSIIPVPSREHALKLAAKIAGACR